MGAVTHSFRSPERLLTNSLARCLAAEIRSAWLVHHVLSFPDQHMSDDDLEAFTVAMGGFGDDPFIAPIPGREHVIAIERRADETSSLFAENFHSDWSFQAVPPAGTCLYGIEIPPVGGDTLFANQHLAWEQMPDDLRTRVEGLVAIHSAKLPYAPKGVYGDNDAKDRSMTIVPSDAAEAMGITSTSLLKLGLVNTVIEEPLGGAHRNPELAAARLKSALLSALEEPSLLRPEELVSRRRARFAAIGEYTDR